MGEELNNPGEQTEEELAGLSGSEAAPESPEGQDGGQAKSQSWTPDQQAWATQRRQEDKEEVRRIRDDSERRVREAEAKVWELTHQTPAQEPTVPDYPTMEGGLDSRLFEQSLEAGLARSPRLQKLMERVEAAESIGKTAAATASMGHYDANPDRFRHMDKVRPQIQQMVAHSPGQTSEQLDALYNHFAAPYTEAELAETRAELAKFQDEKKKELESVSAPKAGGSTALQEDMLEAYREMSPEEWQAFMAKAEAHAEANK